MEGVSVKSKTHAPDGGSGALARPARPRAARGGWFRDDSARALEERTGRPPPGQCGDIARSSLQIRGGVSLPDGSYAPGIHLPGRPAGMGTRSGKLTAGAEEEIVTAE